MNDVNIKVKFKLDDKYGKIPKGYYLMSFDGNYGVVSGHQGYRLINDKGEFVTDYLDRIEPIGNDDFLYQDKNGFEMKIKPEIIESKSGVVEVKEGVSAYKYGIIEKGETIKDMYVGSYQGILYYVGDDLFCMSMSRSQIVKKDGQIILEDAFNYLYDDGKILFENSYGDEIFVVSKNGEMLDSFKTDFQFGPMCYKGGNCLIIKYEDCNYYGINLENKELIEIKGELMNDVYKDDYYLFFDEESGEEIILDSSFKVVKDHICNLVTDLGDGCYSIWDDVNKGYCIMDFDDNVLFDHVKWMRGDLIQIGDNLIYDCTSKKEIILPCGWNVSSWKKSLENDNLLFICRDDNNFTHLSDFDTIDIDVDNIMLGDKYAVINDTIIPIDDLKTLNYSYELIVECNGEISRKEFNKRKEAIEAGEKIKDGLSLLDSDYYHKKSEFEKELEENHRENVKQLIKINMNKNLSNV